MKKRIKAKIATSIITTAAIIIMIKQRKIRPPLTLILLTIFWISSLSSGSIKLERSVAELADFPTPPSKAPSKL